ncbi:uncharacterized protein CHSO_0642 [Chryseobacterium sp. StRB126]|nr:uncharacterized protein CHSO_0642 [Chryseobacterium sp. StRB126]
MDFYYLQTFPHPLSALLLPKNYLKSQEKERLKPTEKANQQDQAILLQDLIPLLPEARAALTTEINCMWAQEVDVIIILATVNNMWIDLIVLAAINQKKLKTLNISS